MCYKIRPARPGDGPALSAIYAPYTATELTFESPAPGPEEFTARIVSVLEDYPFLVCEAGGIPVGYAYAHRYRIRAAYDWDSELSVYLAPEHQGRGVGKALYSALLDILSIQGYVNIYGTVSVPNPPSERLHEGLGFQLVYTDVKTGWKLGRWLDLAYYRLQLRPYEPAPEPVTPSPALDTSAVMAVCERRAEEIGG